LAGVTTALCASRPVPAVHADSHLHLEIPLLAFAALVHLGVALLVGVLGRAGRADDGGGLALAAPRAVLLAVSTAVISATFAWHVGQGGAFEPRTAGALGVRLGFWLLVAWWANRRSGC